MSRVKSPQASGWLRAWETHLVQTQLISAPALWGKLPSHADFISEAAHPLEIESWRRWLGQHDVSAIAAQRSSKPRRLPPQAGWLHTEPVHTDASRGDVPVAFVLPPGALDFARQRYVVGVLMRSCDALGRSHPFIIYQSASVRWVERQWRQTNGRSVWQRATLPFRSLPNQRVEAAPTAAQDWLFWLARLLGRYEQALRTHHGEKPEPPLLWQHFTALVQELWRMHQPGLWHWLWSQRDHPRPSSVVLSEWLDAELTAELADAAEYLHGVRYLPWPDWPALILPAQRHQQREVGALAQRPRLTPQAAFWQQDAQGGYINAAHSLAELWRAS